MTLIGGRSSSGSTPSASTTHPTFPAIRFQQASVTMAGYGAWPANTESTAAFTGRMRSASKVCSPNMGA